MKLKGSLKRLFLVVLAISAVFFTPVGSASATISDAFKKWYALNGIIFPDNCVEAAYTTSASGTVGTVSENSNAAKIWNYFVTANIPGVSDNAAVIAGIMGNFQQETNFNPFSANDTYYGLFQANKDYDPDLLKNIEAAGLSQYWRSESAPEDAVIKAITIELDYLTKQDARFGKDTGYGFLANLSKITNKTPEAYSDLFEVSVEGAVTADKTSPYTGSSNYIEDPVARSIGVQYFSGNPGGGEYYQEAGDRRKFAREIFERYSTAAAATTAAAASPAGLGASSSWPNLNDDAGLRIPFLEKHHDTAVSLGISYGIPWETVVAQGIVESASGSSQIARDKNNFFGIGAYDNCPYDCAFSYPDEKSGWEGYYKNIVETSVYRENGVFSRNSPYGDAVTDPIAYLKAIKAAGYATDSEYVSTIGGVVNSIVAYANAKGWPLSAQVATEHPEWFTNAEKNRQGASVTGTDGVVVSSNLFSWTDGWVSGVPGLTKTDSLDAGLSEMPASAYETTDGKPNKILLHYTEGVTNGIDAFPSNNRFPSHFIVDLTKKEGFQLLTADRPSVATVSGDTTSIQIEIVGFGDPSEGGYQSNYDLHNFGDAEWDYLAVLLGAISEHYNIPLTTPVGWDVTSVSDQSNRIPLSRQSEFDAMTGIVGHMHSPGNSNGAGGWLGDDHTDPGNIWPMVESAIKRNPSASATGIATASNCVSSSPGSSTTGLGGDSIASTARDLAWPDKDHYSEIKPAFATAAKNVGLDSFGTNLSEAQDCGHFVSVVMRSSVDKDFPAGGTGNMEEYMANSSLYSEIKNTGSESGLKPGDILVINENSKGYGAKDLPTISSESNGHIYIYLGGSDASASASYGQRTGNLGEGNYFEDTYNGTTYKFRIFRSTVITNTGSVSGGLTEAQAEAVAAYYRSSAVPADNSTWRMPSNNTKWNCFSFSAWWFQILTSVGYTDSVLTWGEGAKDIAHSISQQFNLETGTTPRVYSIFSVTSGVTVCSDGNLCGHTGVVVAVNGNDVTTIEAAYGADGYTEVVHRDLSYFVNTAHPSETFVYLDTVMDQSKLNNLLTQLGV